MDDRDDLDETLGSRALRESVGAMVLAAAHAEAVTREVLWALAGAESVVGFLLTERQGWALTLEGVQTLADKHAGVEAELRRELSEWVKKVGRARLDRNHIVHSVLEEVVPPDDSAQKVQHVFVDQRTKKGTKSVKIRVADAARIDEVARSLKELADEGRALNTSLRYALGRFPSVDPY